MSIEKDEIIIMIESAEEFVQLKRYNHERALADQATDKVWLSVISRYPHMKQYVIQNKTVNGKILKTLIKDSDWKVRWSIARKDNLNKDFLQKLAKDKDEAVRSRVIDNPKITQEILLSLLKDEVFSVADKAAEKLMKKFNYSVAS